MSYSTNIKKLFLHSGIMKLFEKFQQNESVGILRYHAVVNPEDNYYASPSICIRQAFPWALDQRLVDSESHRQPACLGLKYFGQIDAFRVNRVSSGNQDLPNLI